MIEPCTCVVGMRKCDFHYDQAIEYYSSDAAAAGSAWAESVAQRQPGLLRRPWPVATGRVMGMAKEKIKRWAGGDKRLLNMFGRLCYVNAAGRWDYLRHQARNRRAR